MKFVIFLGILFRLESVTLVTFYAYADEGMIMGADGSVKQKFVCVKPLSC